jgi:hypothetical protein
MDPPVESPDAESMDSAGDDAESGNEGSSAMRPGLKWGATFRAGLGFMGSSKTTTLLGPHSGLHALVFSSSDAVFFDVGVEGFSGMRADRPDRFSVCGMVGLGFPF